MAIDRAMSPQSDFNSGYDIEVEVAPDEETEVDLGGQEQPMAGHKDNLAELIDDHDLEIIAKDLVTLFDADQASREDWLQTYTKGLDFLGFTIEERTKPFKGASGVFHPVMAEAVVRFQSNAIMEIFPAAGPVLANIMGDETPEKIAQAKRVKEELNYQLTDNMSEYRNEMEQLLFRLPITGSAFKKVYYDPLRKRPSACMVPAEDFVVNYGSSDIETCERFTHIMRKSKNEVRKLVRAGFYRDVELPDPVPTYSEEGKAKEDKLTGRQASIESDDRHQLLEFHVSYNLPGIFGDDSGVADPYCITVDRQSLKVLSIYRNWDEADQQRNPEQYFVHYQYVPGLGFYGFGLVHLLGSIAKASTSILRQLVDAGTLSNLPGGLKTKGMRSKGMDEPIQPGEWRDVDVPAGAIKDNLFPLPYKDPSSTLVALLQGIVEEGRRIGSIADVEISSQQANAPVGTTLALMERSLKVMSAVNARMHASLRKELKLISKVIFEYMEPQYDWDLEQKFDRRKDFDGRIDIVPVSDPNAATQAQKIVQMQAVQQLAATAPELYNMKELHRAGLQAIGIKNDDRLLPLDEDPPRLDPVQENMAVLTGQPIKVYPDQDHTAHIQAHLSVMTDPKILEMVQASPNAPKMQGQMDAHMAEHLAFQYRAEIEQTMGVQLPPMGEPLPPQIEATLSRLIADASVRLRKIHEAEAAKKQAEAIAADPVFQLREREIAIKERKQSFDEQKEFKDTILDVAKTVSAEQIDLRKIESNEAIAGANIGANLVTFGAQLESEERREGVALGKEIAENIREDMRTVQQMEQDANEAAAERENKVQVARMKPKPSAKK